jgi:hypothetical protein
VDKQVPYKALKKHFKNYRSYANMSRIRTKDRKGVVRRNCDRGELRRDEGKRCKEMRT